MLQCAPCLPVLYCLLPACSLDRPSRRLASPSPLRSPATRDPRPPGVTSRPPGPPPSPLRSPATRDPKPPGVPSASRPTPTTPSQSRHPRPKTTRRSFGLQAHPNHPFTIPSPATQNHQAFLRPPGPPQPPLHSPATRDPRPPGVTSRPPGPPPSPLPSPAPRAQNPPGVPSASRPTPTTPSQSRHPRPKTTRRSFGLQAHPNHPFTVPSPAAQDHQALLLGLQALPRHPFTRPSPAAHSHYA